MWWCSMLLKFNLFVVVPLRNNGQHEIGKHIK
jgi:hypothetical protein